MNEYIQIYKSKLPVFLAGLESLSVSVEILNVREEISLESFPFYLQYSHTHTLYLSAIWENPN